MKKVLFVLLALCLFVVPVMAQEIDNPVVINWEGDLEDAFIEREYAGKFYLFPDYGIQFLVPAGLDPMELNDEDAELGIFAFFMTENEEMQVAAQFLDYELETLEEVAMWEKQNRGDDMKFAGFYKINGLDAIIFVDTESDVLVANVATSVPKHFIKVTISPISNEELNSLSGFITGSIMPYSPEE